MLLSSHLHAIQLILQSGLCLIALGDFDTVYSGNKMKNATCFTTMTGSRGDPASLLE